jgi:hypothetical protein
MSPFIQHWVLLNTEAIFDFTNDLPGFFIDHDKVTAEVFLVVDVSRRRVVRNGRRLKLSSGGGKPKVNCILLKYAFKGLEILMQMS